MISRTKVVAVIDRAGAKFEWCWNAFSKHKEATTDSSIGRDLVAVQNELISAQWMLNVQYRAIVQEKERLIAGKQKYQGTWFSRRMARLDHYLKAIKSAIGIGKTIGDGYAWIFYHHDVHLIEQHFRRQPQTNLPPGVGGIGERAFVEKLQGFNKHFVLYHGITSFLRIGDVSFINLKTARVASIGEIKTKRIAEDKYEITLGCLYGESFNFPSGAFGQKRPESEEQMPQATKDRFRRQMDEMARAFSSSKEWEGQTPTKVTGSIYFDELDQAITKSRQSGFCYQKAGNSLLIGAIHLRERKLSGRLLSSNIENLQEGLDAVKEHNSSIGNNSLSDNCLFLSTLGFGTDGLPIVAPGTIPLFWWPIKRENLHDLVFGRVVILTMHNPAHFWELLRQNGFVVNVNSRGRLVTATRTEGKRVARLENMDYFRGLSGQFLLSDESVMRLVEKMIKSADAQNFERPIRNRHNASL